MIKKILSVSLLIYGSFQLHAQQTIYDTITFNGTQRAYILYVPASYSTGTPVPLVFNFHGLGSNSFEQMNYADFRPIADTANFIIAHPMGTTVYGTTIFDAGFGLGIDDVGFTSALIDTISTNFSINQNRIYSTGMSNGGFMSYALACGLSDRIAAIASVTGSMSQLTYNSCNPGKTVPIMEIHGTADSTVPYNGGTFSGLVTMMPIPDVLNFWINQNQCSTVPVYTALPDISTTDGCTAEHYYYMYGTESGASVEHYKIIGGGHTWPGSPYIIGTTNQDFTATKEIWRFFSQYDMIGLIGYAGIEEQEAVLQKSIYPNPATDYIEYELLYPETLTQVVLSNIHQQVVKTTYNTTKINLEGLSAGIYFIQFEFSNGNKLVQKFIKQ